MMNEQTLQGNWNEIKGKLKQKYGQLTDDDLTFVQGKEDELLGRLHADTAVRALAPGLEQQVRDGELTATLAAERILGVFGGERG